MSASAVFSELNDFTSVLFSCLGELTSFLVSEPITFIALALIFLGVAVDLLLGVGRDKEDK